MSLRTLSDAERRDWVRLVRTPNIGPLTFARLLERFGTATHALAALPDIANRVGKGRRIELPSVSAIEDEIAATQRLGARLLASCEPDFPKLLVSLDPPPPLLTVLGNLALARPDAVAIVGAHNASAVRRKIAHDMAAELGRASLAIITAVTRGKAVVEAAERSGSLISARMAGEQGREVMAVPGSPLDPRAAGTNGLIRQGAALVRHAQDVLEVLAGLPPLHVAAPPPPAFTPEFLDGPLPQDQLARVRQALSPHPMPIDEIARAAGLNSAQCQAVLMELELAGEALSYPGGLVARAV
jgi:predicted Rossmann fold nucleotide-binding protein DprA/Smf involved in DNA uptake